MIIKRLVFIIFSILINQSIQQTTPQQQTTGTIQQTIYQYLQSLPSASTVSVICMHLIIIIYEFFFYLVFTSFKCNSN